MADSNRPYDDLSEEQVNVLYWLWLSLRCRPGSSDADLLMEHFAYDPIRIYKADEATYKQIPKLREELITRLCDKTATKEREIKLYCQAHNIGILTPDSPLYPRRLGRIPKRPLVLYYRGRLPELNDGVLIATVGTRRMTEYGRREAYAISYDLARCGAIVVSGMAKGIDGICHRGALDAGGHTIAVLGCGIDRAYPAEHYALMEEIAAKGTVITEYPPFTEPAGHHFPARNRIISGLCQGTLVLEADGKSGAMITAKLAHEQGRDVFSLPGKVGEMNSVGTNSLIQNGAKAITCAEDLLCEYEYLYPGHIFIGNLRQTAPCYAPSGSRPSPSPIGQRNAAATTTPLEESREELPVLKEEPVAMGEIKERGDDSYALPDSPMSPAIQNAKPIKTAKKKSNAKKAASDSKEKAKKKASQTAPGKAPIPCSLPDETQRAIYEKLQSGPKTADELTDESLPIRRILPALTILEVKGLVEALPGGRFRRTDL